MYTNVCVARFGSRASWSSGTRLHTLKSFRQIGSCPFLVQPKRALCQQTAPTSTSVYSASSAPSSKGVKALLAVREATNEEAVESILKAQQPVVWRGLAKDWPCMAWNDLDALKQRIGQEIVPVEVGKTYLDPDLEQLGASMQDLLTFLQTFMHESPSSQGLTNVYFAQQPLSDHVPALLQDIKEPAIAKGRLASVQGWFGPCGTVTPAHTDPYNNVLVQVVGRKYVRLYSPVDAALMHPFAVLQRQNTSQVDVLDPDLGVFPDFAQAQGYEITLEPGDAIFIPLRWWHCCKSLTGSISVNFWW